MGCEFPAIISPWGEARAYSCRSYGFAMSGTGVTARPATAAPLRAVTRGALAVHATLAFQERGPPRCRGRRRFTKLVNDLTIMLRPLTTARKGWVVRMQEPPAHRPSEPVTARSTSARTSLDKAIDILNAFEGAGVSRSLTQVVEATHLPKGTAHRLLATLVARGLVERRDTRYVLGTRMFSLGNQVPFCRPRQLRDVAKPVLHAMHGRARECVHLAVLEDDQVLYVDKLAPPHQMLPTSVGAKLPAHQTALGKALLAYSGSIAVENYLRRQLGAATASTVTDPEKMWRQLVDVRAHGFAIERNESMIGLSCVAAPIFGAGSQHPIAAVSVSLLGDQASPLDFVPMAQTAARSISAALRSALRNGPPPRSNAVLNEATERADGVDRNR
jgi:DNA-binding IclR family transcriptional regulator